MTRPVKSTAAVMPGLAVADLLSDIACFQLRRPMADRGERHLPTFLPQSLANFRLSQGPRRSGFQDLLDQLGIAAALRPTGGRSTAPSDTATRSGPAPGSRRRTGSRSRASAPPCAAPRAECGTYPTRGWARRQVSDGVHRCRIASGKGLTAHLLDLLLQFGHRRSCHRVIPQRTHRKIARLSVPSRTTA